MSFDLRPWWPGVEAHEDDLHPVTGGDALAQWFVTIASSRWQRWRLRRLGAGALMDAAFIDDGSTIPRLIPVSDLSAAVLRLRTKLLENEGGALALARRYDAADPRAAAVELARDLEELHVQLGQISEWGIREVAIAVS